MKNSIAGTYAHKLNGARRNMKKARFLSVVDEVLKLTVKRSRNRYADYVTFIDKGYAQVDTAQDAWYFGTWASPSDRRIVSYAEGDITIEDCESDKEFVTALQAFYDWNAEQGHFLRGPNWDPEKRTFEQGKPMAIDPGFNVELKQAFIDMGAGHFLH